MCSAICFIEHRVASARTWIKWRMDLLPPDTKAQESGEYVVLARKYRPRDFSTMIGQEALVRTLRNAFETGRLAGLAQVRFE